MSQAFDFENLVELCRQTHEETRHSAGRAVDRSLVARNWLFGRYFVEYEQNGADRAKYGSQLLARIASRLQRIGIRGSSVTRLKLYRRFYQQQKGIGPTPSAQLASLAFVDGTPAIRPTPSVESTEPARNRRAISGGREISEMPSRNSAAPLSGSLPTAQIVQTLSAKLMKRLSLAWSHYVTLLTTGNREGRRFCELEAAGNGWSVRELERQIAVVELTLPEQANIYASKYQLYLPSKQELAAQLERIQRELNYPKGKGDE